MDVGEEVKRIEKELVELIIAHLKSNQIAVETARQQAKDFLSLLPVADQRDLLNKLKNLSEKYMEAKQVYAEELGKVNETVRQQTLDQMRIYIQQGNIDAAIAAAKVLHPAKNQEQAEQSAEAPVEPVVLAAQQEAPAPQQLQTQIVSQPAQQAEQPVAPVPQVAPVSQPPVVAQSVDQSAQVEQPVPQPDQTQTAPQVANQPIQQVQQPAAEKGGQA